MLSTIDPTPVQLERERTHPAALGAWLDGAIEPGLSASIWRLYLAERADGATLLSALDQHGIPARIVGVFDEIGIWLYCWLSMPNPCIGQFFAAYDTGATIVAADQVRAGPGVAWATGAALRRLLRARAEVRS